MTEEAIAYHEAAHAVANFSFGFQAKIVTIIPSIHALGLCDSLSVYDLINQSDMTETRHDLRNYVIACLAGPWAEHLATSQSVDRTQRDYDRVQLVLENYLPRLSLATAEARTRHWLRQHWPSIQRLAMALLKRRTLSEKEAKAIIGATMNAAEGSGSKTHKL